MGKRVKFIPLEIETVLADCDFQTMNAEQRGVYFSLIIYMYANDGKCRLDTKYLSRLMNCKNFPKVWQEIKKKFQVKEGIITHKRVSRELRRAKRLMQAKKKAGLKGAKERWHSHPDAIGTPNGTPNSTAMANENVNNNNNENKNTREEERNEIKEREEKTSNTNSRLRASVSSIPIRPRLPRTEHLPKRGGEPLRLDSCLKMSNIGKKLSESSNL